MKKIFFLLPLVFLASCDDSENDSDNSKKVKKTQVPVDNTISIDFKTNTFNSKEEKQLLEEIKICNPKELDDVDPKKCACSPKFFKFFKLSEGMDLKNGFVLVVKSEFGGFPIRRTIVFERENGVLVRVNGFNANLIEQREAKSGYKDLILRFPDRVDPQARLTYYNCRYTWKDGKYQLAKVEEIDEDYPRRIKAEFQDSMNKVIVANLERNNMFF